LSSEILDYFKHLTVEVKSATSQLDGRDLNQLVGSTLECGGIGAPSSGRDVYLRDQSLVGTVATTLNPESVNILLVQYARRHYTFPGVTGQPNLDIPNTLLFGNNFGVIESTYESRVQLLDSLTRVTGNHVAKFGGDFNYVNNFAVVPEFTPMRIVLPGINCLIDFANFVNPGAGVPSAPADGPCPVANLRSSRRNRVLTGFGLITLCVVCRSYSGRVQLVHLLQVAPDSMLASFQLRPLIRRIGRTLICRPRWGTFSTTLSHNYSGLFAQDQWHGRSCIQQPCSWDSTPMATRIPSPTALGMWVGTLTTGTISTHGICASLVISRFGSESVLI
jgi:hypothetical protein